jgi:hypothetical protein
VQVNFVGCLVGASSFRFEAPSCKLLAETAVFMWRFREGGPINANATVELEAKTA